MFNGWLQARAANNPQLQQEFVRRFTPDYRSAVAAWLKTEPFTNPAAPAGPGYMPQYRNEGLEQAKQLNAQAQATFAEGTAARETADLHIRAGDGAVHVGDVPGGDGPTPQGPRVRIGANAVAFGLLAYGLHAVSTLPRL